MLLQKKNSHYNRNKNTHIHNTSDTINLQNVVDPKRYENITP